MKEHSKRFDRKDGACSIFCSSLKVKVLLIERGYCSLRSMSQKLSLRELTRNLPPGDSLALGPCAYARPQAGGVSAF